MSRYKCFLYVNCSCIRYILYLLHSQMQSSDQKRAFKNPGPGVRKIVSVPDFFLTNKGKEVGLFQVLLTHSMELKLCFV